MSTYVLGNQTYLTKKSIYEKASLILFKHKVGDLLEGEELSFIIDLFLTYPKVKGKIRNNILVGVQVDKVGRYKCYKVLTARGTLLKFSIYKCTCEDKYESAVLHLNGESALLLQVHTFIKSFKLAGRKAIELQIRDFKIRNKRFHRNIRYLQVDHVYPLTYAQIVYDYLWQYTGDWKAIKFVKNKFYYFKDSRAFRDYHESVAKLQILSKKENLRQPNANLDWESLINKLLGRENQQ
jgi:hypothetical protein